MPTAVRLLSVSTYHSSELTIFWLTQNPRIPCSVLQAWFLGSSFVSFHNNAGVVSVCPFYFSRADIKPSRYIPWWWSVYPPEPSKLKKLFQCAPTMEQSLFNAGRCEQCVFCPAVLASSRVFATKYSKHTRCTDTTVDKPNL